MAIFNKSVESARNDVTKAQTTVTEWETKASDARREAAELEATSGARILADETQAEKISLQIQSLERRARAYDGAAAEARVQLRERQRKALEVEASFEDKAMQEAEKRLESHKRKTGDLLAQLMEIDGCTYIPDLRDQLDEQGRTWAWNPRGNILKAEVRKHQIRAAAIRHFIATGEVLQDTYVLHTDLELGPNEVRPTIYDGDFIPDSLHEARAAGLNFSTVGA